MKKLNIRKVIGFAAAAFGFAVAASGVTYTWVGASGGDWSTASNWSPTGVPVSGDTIALTTAVTVTANVTGEATYKLLLQHPSAKFVKAGAGTLTVSHAYGVAQGRLIVAAGCVNLSGNGETEAPGAFGEIVIQRGASAQVVQSPRATCHGMVYRVGLMSPDIKWDAGQYRLFYSSANWEQYLSAWDDPSVYYNTEANEFPVTTVRHVPAADACAVNGRDGIPAPYGDAAKYYKWQVSGLGNVVYMMRGIALNEAAVERTNFITGLTPDTNFRHKLGYAVFCDGVVSPGVFGEYAEPTLNPLKTTGAAGWNAMDFLVLGVFDRWSNKDASYPVYSCTPLVEGGHDLLVPDALWSGVCCNALTVESGATLTVADGQAFAVANARGLRVEGTFVSETEDAYLYLASDWARTDDDAPLSAAALRGFKGTVRLGATARLDGESETATVPYTISGSGELVVTEANQTKIADDFTGTLVVDEGFTYALPTDNLPVTLAEKPELQPVSSETWAFLGGAVSAPGVNAVQLLNSATRGSAGERAVIVGKVGVPAYCPFELSCDLWVTGTFNWHGPEANIALVAHAAGPDMAFASNAGANSARYILPATSIPFGFNVSAYEQNFIWLTGVVGSSSWWENLGNVTWNAPSNMRLPYRLSYDGRGTFTASFQYSSTSNAVYTRTYPALAAAKYAETTLYPSLAAGAASGNYGIVTASNISFKVMASPSVIDRRIELRKNATLSLTAGSADGAAALSLSHLKMGEASRLALSPIFSGVETGVLLDGVTIAGSASVGPAEGEGDNVTTVLGSLTFDSAQPATLTVDGGKLAYQTPFTYVYPRAWRGAFSFVDSRAATVEAVPEQADLTVKTSAGRDRTSRCEVSEAGIRLVPPGMAYIIR